MIEMEQNKDREWDDLQKVNSKFFGTFDGSHVFGYIEELRDEIDRLRKENIELRITDQGHLRGIIKNRDKKIQEMIDLIKSMEEYIKKIEERVKGSD